MTTQIYELTLPGDYTYDAEIDVAAGTATLADIGTNTDFTENFNDAAGLTFGAEVEISGGTQAQLVHTGLIYPTTNPTIDIDQAITATATGQLVTAWNSFTATITEPGSDTVTFVLSDDNGVTFKYWDGTAWSVSTGFAESNTGTDINTNIGTFPLTAAGLKVRIFLHSDDGSTTPAIGNLVINYDDYIYATTNPTLYPNTAIPAGSISAFTATETVVGADTLTYTLVVDSVEMYWDGAAWSAGGSFANSNLAVDINTNIASLNLTGGKSVYPIAYFHSNDGSTAPTLDDITIVFVFQSIAPTTPNECIVYGYIYGGDGEPIADVIVDAYLTAFGYYNAEILLTREKFTTTTDALGYWELSLIENENMTGAASYTFDIRGDGIITRILRVVPNSAVANFAALVAPA